MSESPMRAILIKDGKGPVENLYIGEAPKPVPGPSQVLVQIIAFGLNRIDVPQRQGMYPAPPGASSILGIEFSGVVAELGRDAAEWSIGDAVLGLAAGGAYAEFIAVPQSHLMAKPAHLSWQQAASIPENFLTAFQAVVLCSQIKPHDDVLVHAGASGVGVAAIQLARFYDAHTVTATASTSEKLDWLLSLPAGATHAVNYKTHDFAAGVKDATGGKGVDVLVDVVGSSHWIKNIESLALDGRMTMLGLLSGREAPAFDLAPILFKRLRIQGSTLRTRTLEYQTQLIGRFRDEVLGHITGAEGEGKIRTYIHKVYPWTAIQDATREMEENKNSGKIVVEVVHEQ